MKNIQSKAVQIGGYLRIFAIAVAIIATLILGSRAYAIAPHMPDVALQKEIDHHKEATENKNNRKASEKVDKYNDSKKKSKESGAKSKFKEKKPPKPSKEDKKRAKKDKARTLNKK
jgi:hypothetical protein